MQCSVCGVTVVEDKYFLHLRKFHDDEKNLLLSCTQCSNLFSTVRSFHKHWYAKHYVSKKRVHEFDPSDTSNKIVSECCSPSKKRVAQSTDEDSEMCGSGKSPSACDVGSKISETEKNPESNFCVESVELDSDSSAEESECEESTVVEDSVSDNVSGQSSSAPLISLSQVNSEVLSSESFLEQSSCAKWSSLNQVSNNDVGFRGVDHDAAMFVLSLREKSGVKNSSVPGILNDSEALIQQSLEKFALKVKTSLQKNNVNLDDVMDVPGEIQSCSKVFNGLKSVHQQDKVFTESLHVVTPKKIPLGRELKRVRQKGAFNRKTVMFWEEFVYVPLKELVDKLVNHPDFNYFVENKSNTSNSKFLDSYMKGNLSSKNKILQEHPDALRFVLYYDDLECCSPLKSRAGKQKLGSFYIFLDNIPLKFRSNLNLICLSALVHTALIKESKYGIDSALEKIVEDIQEFENGVVLSNGVKVYGTLIAAIGDNLGVHSLGGFKEGFSAHRCCRYCMATYGKVQSMTTEIETLLRNEESHTQQIKKVQTTKGKNSNLSTQFGINRDSKLNELISFHVTLNLPPDIMHDILEGILPLTLKRLLHYLISEKKLFTLDWLNKKLKDFDYEFSESKDKPSEIKAEHLSNPDSKLHQSASQMWLLGFVLPLIVGPLVSSEDKRWKNFLDLLEICRIVFTVNISMWMVSYLRDLIEEYLTVTLELYGNLTPKFHHLTHYPTQILRFGSLVNCMCMRCEAKHKFFKQLVVGLGNYKNIPWSLASKHQINQAYCWSKSLRKIGSCGAVTEIDRRSSSLGFVLPASFDKVHESKWVELDGIRFVVERSIIAVGCDDCLPVFAKIVRIIVGPEIMFVCQKVKTLKRDVHCGSFVVQVFDAPLILYKPGDMIVHSVFHCHFVDGNFHIFTKYCIGDSL